jgi:hypothetical protein
MTHDKPTSVAVSRRIEAGPSEIFQILADPKPAANATG